MLKNAYIRCYKIPKNEKSIKITLNINFQIYEITTQLAVSLEISTLQSRIIKDTSFQSSNFSLEVFVLN